MIQEEAVRKIQESLMKDPLVQAIFLKGSMGRGEHDEYSDVDLYCLVREEDEKEFLSARMDHLKSYRDIDYYDEVFIIAPQLIVVYDNRLHLDLFTVTQRSFSEKDYFKVVYDPDQILDTYKGTQYLSISDKEFANHAFDVSWFLYRYEKAHARGTDLYAIIMIQHVLEHLSKVLLHRYCPERTLLGMKTIEKSLPDSIILSLREIYQNITPDLHSKAVQLIIELLKKEKDWIYDQLETSDQATAFLKETLSKKKKITITRGYPKKI